MISEEKYSSVVIELPIIIDCSSSRINFFSGANNSSFFTMLSDICTERSVTPPITILLECLKLSLMFSC